MVKIMSQGFLIHCKHPTPILAVCNIITTFRVFARIRVFSG